MNISIFGLGYVGCVGAACLAKLGHRVVGVDVNENKVRLINEGKPTIIEEGIAELCAEAHSKGLMSATMDVREAVCRESDVLVVTNKENEFAELLARYPNKTVVDLVRQWKEVDYSGHYEGLSWGDINTNRSGQETSIAQDFRQTEF